MLSTSATGFRETPLSALGKFNPLLDAILRLGDLAVLVTSGMIARTGQLLNWAPTMCMF